MPTLTFSVFPFFATMSTNFRQTTHLTFYGLILNGGKKFTLVITLPLMSDRRSYGPAFNSPLLTRVN